jgi:hypothetical protein
MSDLHFSQMIKKLRKHEVVLLYANNLVIAENDAQACLNFLQKEFERESLNFPHQPPAFDSKAALLGARVIYLASQFLLYRENKPKDLPGMFPEFDGKKNPAAMLSADLCLRFLPDLIEELELIDITDELIGLLKNLLVQWPYSALLLKSDSNKIAFSLLTTDPCLHQLSADRITARHKIGLAQLPEFSTLIESNLSIYKQDLWPEFAAAKQNG